MHPLQNCVQLHISRCGTVHSSARREIACSQILPTKTRFQFLQWNIQKMNQAYQILCINLIYFECREQQEFKVSFLCFTRYTVVSCLMTHCSDLPYYMDKLEPYFRTLLFRKHGVVSCKTSTGINLARACIHPRGSCPVLIAALLSTGTVRNPLPATLHWLRTEKTSCIFHGGRSYNRPTAYWL